MNRFLRGVIELREREREEQLAETRGVVLEKQRGVRPASGMTPEEAARRHRERMAKLRAEQRPPVDPAREALRVRALELRAQGVPTFKIVDLLRISPQALGHLLRGAK